MLGVGLLCVVLCGITVLRYRVEGNHRGEEGGLMGDGIGGSCLYTNPVFSSHLMW